jgi:ribosomal protein L32
LIRLLLGRAFWSVCSARRGQGPGNDLVSVGISGCPSSRGTFERVLVYHFSAHSVRASVAGEEEDDDDNSPQLINWPTNIILYCVIFKGQTFLFSFIYVSWLSSHPLRLPPMAFRSLVPSARGHSLLNSAATLMRITPLYRTSVLSRVTENSRENDTLPMTSLISDIWESILRAVPKKKTSYMKKRHRQMAGKALKDVKNLSTCPSCGSMKRSHVLCQNCVKGEDDQDNHRLCPSPSNCGWLILRQILSNNGKHFESSES